MIGLLPKKRASLKAIIEKASAETGIGFEILAAIIWQESQGNRYAMRYEPGFYERYMQGKTRAQLGGYWPKFLVSDETERRLRSTSFGLMQIMGQTAREAGYSKTFLASLTKPSLNVDLGAKILARYIKQKGTLKAGIARYNGHGQAADDYARKVLLIAKGGDYRRLFIDVLK